ncbi:hypothetical protein, partial [Nocardia sp. NPDC058497]|uniref:hypothetical protein n=1 Tax=Nocardia sp. NPDC058497 TaxID=3346529 RepID=UPI003653E848
MTYFRHEAASAGAQDMSSTVADACRQRVRTHSSAAYRASGTTPRCPAGQDILSYRIRIRPRNVRLDRLAVMKRPGPSSPPTYDEALRIARDLAQDPDTLIPYVHQGLENARYGRGFAFLVTIGTERGDTDGYVLVTTTAHGGGLLSMVGQTIDTVIAEHLARAEHSNRKIPDSELSAAHRVA